MQYFVFNDNNILVSSSKHELPSYDDYKNLKTENNFVDKLNDFTVSQVDSDCSILEHEFIPLRQYFAENANLVGTKAARAKGLLDWNNATQYCATCGAKLIIDEKQMAKDCPTCKKQFFPRIEPCVIVLIYKDDKILLARHKQRNQNIYTCIAGFIEIGESAEQAVEREVKEETNIEIKNLQYFKSQGWPFPDQLMFAYFAEYKSGEIKVQEDELYEAEWFSCDNLPSFPRPGSVAHKLITEFVNNKSNRKPTL